MYMLVLFFLLFFFFKQKTAYEMRISDWSSDVCSSDLTLFGRNSVGGALRIFTKNPSFTRSGDATVESGFYAGDGESRAAPHYTARGFFTTPLIDQKLAASVSAGYDWTKGFLTNEATR